MTRGGGAARTGALLIVAAAALWGTAGTAQTYAPPEATPLALAALRLGVAAVALVTVVAARTGGPGAIGSALGSGRRGATVVAAAGVTAFQVLFFLAVRRSGVALGTVVTIGSAPIVTGLLAWATTRQRPAGTWAVATGLAIAGVALLLLPSGGAAGMDALGLAAAVGAGSGYAVYTVATRRVLDAGVAPLPAAAAAFAVAALLASPLLVVNDLSWATTARGLAVVLWLGLAATALAYGLFASGLRTVPPATATTLGLVEPLVATVLGVALLGERPGPTAILGAVLLLAGLALTARSTRSA